MSIALDNAGLGIPLCDVTQSADGGNAIPEASRLQASAASLVHPQRKDPAAATLADGGMEQIPQEQEATETVPPSQPVQSAEIEDAAVSTQSQEAVPGTPSAAEQLQEEIPHTDVVPAHTEESAEAVDVAQAESQAAETSELHQEPADQTVREDSPIKVLNFLAETGSDPAPVEEAAPAALTETVTASTSPAYTEDMSVEEITARMTVEEAQKIVVTSGPNKGWTLAQVAERRPSSLKFFTTPYCEATNIFKAAATLMLQEVNQQKAG